MRSNVAINMNSTGIPVLSLRSGHRLINEVTQKAANSFNAHRQETHYPANSAENDHTESQPVYAMTANGVKQTNTANKGRLLYAVA